jgi:AcrR family transcriptional regulator
MAEQITNQGSVIDAPVKRSLRKRSMILNAAMHHFADYGYEAARVGDMANQLGIAKGSVFQHFGSKDGLFLEAYKSAMRLLPPYLSVPPDVQKDGFFAVVKYRLSLPADYWEQYRVPYRIVLLGNYGSDLNLKKRITHFLATEDPLGTAAFVKMGIERGEVRTDVDFTLVTSILECTFERMQDFLLTSEPDRDLFHRTGNFNGGREQLIDQFVTILRGAIGTQQAAGATNA